MLLEVTIRAFYASEEGVNAVPKTSVIVDSDNQIKLDVVAAALAKALQNVPLKLREMTQEEVTAYMAQEKKDQDKLLFDANEWAKHKNRTVKKGIIRATDA